MIATTDPGSLEIRISLEPGLVELKQHPRFVDRQLLVAEGALDLLARRAEKIVGAELYVLKHLADGIAFDDLVNRRPALLVHADVYRVGVAEEVMQVAENFLISTHEERGQEVIAPVVGVQLQNGFHVTAVDEAIDLAVAVAGDV